MAKKAEKTEELSLEDKFEMLDKMIERLEQTDVSLDESFQLYSKGMALVQECHNEIQDVEGKILKLSDNGNLSDFE